MYSKRNSSPADSSADTSSITRSLSNARWESRMVMILSFALPPRELRTRNLTPQTPQVGALLLTALWQQV
jgi:hypothetical protein